MKLRAFSFLLLASCAAATSDEAESTSSDLTGIDQKLDHEVYANLQRLEKEIGASHLESYGLPNIDLPGKFMWALDIEYKESPALLRRRAEVLASPVYFTMPEILPDATVGRRTPFHGMDETAFSRLGSNEDFVWSSHLSFNGGQKDGIRPFSVCETKFLIAISKNEIADPAYAQGGYVVSFDAYAHAYQAWTSGHCSTKDLEDFYNYRGLGELRPSWLESNYQDRVLRRYAQVCKNPPQDWWSRCGEYGNGRLKLREKKNRAFALREMVYDPRPTSKIGSLTDEQLMLDPYQTALFLEDRTNDGVGELVTPGPLELLANARIQIVHSTLGTRWSTVSSDRKSLLPDGAPSLAIASATLAISGTGSFTASLDGTFSFADGSTATSKIPPRALYAIGRVDPAWKASYADQSDWGLTKLFADGSGCTGETVSPATCPLLKRFTSMLDRHESFYATYSSNDDNDSTVIQQPSPLVACSVTVNASRVWAWAGTPPGGRAGLIFLMRVPYAEILSSDRRSIDTLGRLSADPRHGGPAVLTLEKAYAQGGLDMSRVWLDLSTLSNDIYAGENEVSKIGDVRAEEIEGLLVIGKPGALP